MKIFYARILSFFVILALSTVQGGCFKTRAQLKKDDQDHSDSNDDNGDSANAGSPKVRSYQYEEFRSELAKLNGAVEELQHQLKPTTVVGANGETATSSNSPHQLREDITRLENRIAEMEKTQLLLLEETKSLKEAPSGSRSTSSSRRTVSREDSLREGFALLEDSSWDSAGEKFKEVLQAGAKGNEGAAAHFGLGRALFGEKDYRKSIVELSKVQEVSSKSPRIPASLYYIGKAFEKLNMKKEAKGFYADLIERFPKSDEAKKAKALVK